VVTGDNGLNHSMSAIYLDKELSLLRQEQINLGNERRKLQSHAESVSSEMFAECQVRYLPVLTLRFVMQSFYVN
jgi:hypothetical protein